MQFPNKLLLLFKGNKYKCNHDKNNALLDVFSGSEHVGSLCSHCGETVLLYKKTNSRVTNNKDLFYVPESINFLNKNQLKKVVLTEQ